MRGKPSDCWKTLPELRITPADAGKTFRQIYSYRIGQDHPRGCGENRGSERIMHWATGSPPRMRGKQSVIIEQKFPARITPADAGKTSGAHELCSRPEDHPRGCGENPPSGLIRYTLAGSPPRMRGKPSLQPLAGITLRITPADAGKTLHVPCLRVSIEDHPRGCGENQNGR